MAFGFAFSDIVTAVVVVLVPIGCWVLIAPGLFRKHLILASVIWGLPYAIGQFSQSGKWGWIWMQYHLLDFSYGPWATVCGVAGLSVLARWTGRKISIKVRALISFGIVMGFAFFSEIYDSVRDWSVDWGDYLAFGLGAAITTVLYKLLERTTSLQAVTS